MKSSTLSHGLLCALAYSATNHTTAAHIPTKENLHGISSLFDFRPETAKPLRELAEVLFRTHDSRSTLSSGDRELIASYVSFLNECDFCHKTHGAVAKQLLKNNNIVDAVKKDIHTAPISEKLKILLIIAGKIQKGGKSVTTDDVLLAKKHGATDHDYHDTVLIASAFCMYNRYVDGHALLHTPTDPKFYEQAGERIAEHGYMHNTAQKS